MTRVNGYQWIMRHSHTLAIFQTIPLSVSTQNLQYRDMLK